MLTFLQIAGSLQIVEEATQLILDIHWDYNIRSSLVSDPKTNI